MDREKYKKIILPATWISTIPNCSFSGLHPSPFLSALARLYHSDVLMNAFFPKERFFKADQIDGIITFVTYMPSLSESLKSGPNARLFQTLFLLSMSNYKSDTYSKEM